jgi:hypothetical protein
MWIARNQPHGTIGMRNNPPSNGIPAVAEFVQDPYSVVTSLESEFRGGSFFSRVQMDVKRWELCYFVYFVGHGVFSRLYFMKPSGV